MVDCHLLKAALFDLSIKYDVCCVLCHDLLFVTPWTVACQAPLSMGFSRKKYRRGLPFPPLGDLPDPGTEPTALASPALAGRVFNAAPPGKSVLHYVGGN